MASQPIALPGAEYYGDNPGAYNDYPMQSVSPNTDFNPASYQRHFLGSPISWKMGSFGNRYIPSQSPTARLLHGFDPVVKNSVESDRGSIINAFNVFNAEVSPGDYARNYSCCNLQLNDLHALLEHFEEVHIVRQPQFEASANNIDLAIPFNPVPMNSYSNQLPQQQPQSSQHVMYNSTYTNPPTHQTYAADNGFDPDDMDLGDEESSISHAQQQHNQQHHQQQLHHHQYPLQVQQQVFSHQPGLQQTQASAHSSPDSGSSSTPPETPIISTPASAYSHPPPTAYPHAYSSYIPPHVYNPAPLKTSSSSLDGALGENPTLHPGSKPASPSKCVTPSLLFDQGPATAGPSSTSSSDFNILSNAGQRGSKSMPGTPLRSSPPPLPNGKKKQRMNAGSSSLAGALTDTIASATAAAAGSSSAGSTPIIPQSNSLANLSAATLATLTGLTSSKPFKCPKPNCNKSYKQANGLKYHMTHGSCVFTPAREVEQVRAIIGEHQRARLAAANASAEEGGQSSTPGSPGGEAGVMQPDAGLQLSESELKELEREADKRLRPFACGVGDCSRRYKNMNGLRYHYQHSGDHGAIGLAMLANGTHDCISQNSAHHHSNHHHHHGGGGERSVERGRARSGERGGVPIGLNGVKQERSKSKRHDGLSSTSTSRTPSRNVSRVGTPVPTVPPLPLQQAPNQQSHQTTFPQNPPSTATLSLSLQMIPPNTAVSNPSQQTPNSAGYIYQQQQQQPLTLSTQMSQLGVQSAPASPLGLQYPSSTGGTFQPQQPVQLGLGLPGVQVQAGGSHPPSPLGQGSFAVQQQQAPSGYGDTSM